MLSSRYRPWHVPLFAAKFARLRLQRRPVLLNLEVTMRCNASCGFCDYWQTPKAMKAKELAEFADVARRFDPMMITFTGGEPTLRRDLEDIVRAVRDATGYCYLTMITHGGMLSLERARSLWDAGLDQFNISLDYLDERHDEARGIPGLTAKILAVVPELRRAGIGSVRFNTVIKDDNLDQLLPIVKTAARLGAGVNFSVYTDAKNGNRAHLIGQGQHGPLDAVIAELLAYKRRRRGVITNSDHYLREIPRWVRGEMTEPCPSGTTTVHVDPYDKVRRCPDFPPDVDWKEWQPYEPIACDDCFYACRGEAQAPLDWSRVRDMMAAAPVPQD
jgi:MoaA/NifB/PqqE/SkfB family radical SAM enzyme